MKYKILHWSIIIIFVVSMLSLKRYTDRLEVTMEYASDCFATLKEGRIMADSAFLRSSKRDIWIDHIREALALEPPRLADRDFVAAMQQFLRESENVLQNVDGELKTVVEVMVLIAAVYADVKLKSGGKITTEALKLKLRELSAEADEYERYIVATSNLQSATLDLIPFFLRWQVSNKPAISSPIPLRVD